MSAKHTPGPILYRQSYANRFDLYKEIEGKEPQIIGAVFSPVGRHDDEANAKRLVLSYNSCESLADPSVVPGMQTDLNDARNGWEAAVENVRELETEASALRERVEHLEKVEHENRALRKIADYCVVEIDHGFDLPSDVFDATEDWRKEFEKAGVK